LLNYITNNTDKIISEIDNNENLHDFNITEDELENILLEMIEDGEIELIVEDGDIKYKLAE
jgi:hypothetical protein